ncbi:hypothetical protein CYLTODRAFT_457299 [Cylindrobasidium torrendii FP15055 ss-10]|uniref:Uncharacterized protein n=1 Tax=Cylindrobasidium torrendii FP15055 ss-10 TaxID=1314674 RepID=A0A0D7B498_9AGAR|nr:hypothetical protein CYLTODRAFT_457299 [Cylindrobasidium torrendii FP15055 ss-10]
MGGKYHFDNLGQLYEHSERWQHDLSYVMSFNTRDIVQKINPAASHGPGPDQPRRGHDYQQKPVSEKAHHLRLAAPPPNAHMIPKQETSVRGVLAKRAAYMPSPSKSAAASVQPHAMPKLEFDQEQAHHALRK